MRKQLFLLFAILLLTTVGNAQDTTKAQPPKQQQPALKYKIFTFDDQTIQALYGMIGVCPDDITGPISLKQMRKLIQDEYNNQPKFSNDTAKAPIEEKVKKK